jgi:hypothetical protein
MSIRWAAPAFALAQLFAVAAFAADLTEEPQTSLESPEAHAGGWSGTTCTIRAGQVCRGWVEPTCYNRATGARVRDLVTLSIFGTPTTGGAKAGFVPDPIVTFHVSYGGARTTVRTKPGRYTVYITGYGPVCGNYGTLVAHMIVTRPGGATGDLPWLPGVPPKP